jgi:hypothetical protein
MMVMRTCVGLLVVLAACGDDGGSTVDAMGSGSDAAGSGSDAGGMDMGGGLQGSTMFATPTDIEVGQTGNGTLEVATSSFGPQHFWRFTPPTTGSYTITLTGPTGMSTNWCGNSASVQGCGCFQGTTPPFPCCTVGAANCTAITEGAMAGDDGIFVVFNDGAAQGSYTITLAAP